ncbi:ubiquitin carboxyl-terminal hydrolase 42-like isoform X1 [Varroa destructor]|uniref:USP domain-containing protein n=1 Tax=Varroa destructor TaxID=109461 RepID=A0A7M7KJM7_VARDE|nr:ubiquitin carboxyl-terminal hydrolase 42-like isoform X1 [Varroa destructor]XP_022667859.1 ubiquitin carboxyl-terminal hydrolase 42-like isoform X1 [Varroa destructor]XP_022667860.1 ubiquitin carboxyl-terminal hydrolase 42-like isoform X1 [Varroa destructor]XP_022667861.1 ubiquitin carboxyl-terminal hydrolase 42-like isoform X1 [Varroa destructor]XP_022667862.1 ubiquitin carboxyl-terminal hydrolase 42-like isoform X1 [Varroa destructor]XP_022667863.1 ubiquitin carboxyl-terminal hydrolase 42
METLVSSYLSKKLSSNGGPSKAPSFSENLETSSRVQGLLSGGITFTRAGPQNDPWLNALAKLPCKTLSSVGPTNQRLSQSEQTSTSSSWNLPPSSPTTSQVILSDKAQKRPLDAIIDEFQQESPDTSTKHQRKQDHGPSPGNHSKVCSVVLRNSGSRVQVGLTNVGNTCYFNAMLQCLTNCKPFYNYIRSEAHDRTICRRGDQCVLCLLKSFCVSQMPVNPNEKVVSGSVLRDLLVKMRTAVRRWKIHAHQSVDEILSYVLDSMWDRDMAYFGVTDRQHTPMMGLFGTLVEQQYACSLCGEASISTVVEPTLILGLVNGDRRSVQDRLRMEYGLTETLSEPKSKCDACGQSRTPRPTMKRVLKNLPMILVVMLKRFYVIDGISHKINQFVQFPESLDLRPCMDTSSVAQNSLYRLSGVVEHWGKSMTDGHYVAYCKNYCQQRRAEAWFCLNDRQVRTIDSREVLQKQAYLLFYTVQGQATRTIDTVSPARAAVINGNEESSSGTTTIREAKVAKISPPGQHALKITKLIPSKYIPIVVLKKANPDKHGVVSISATSALNNSTQVTFSKQKSTGLPFVNGNGPAALKSPILKINGPSNSQPSGDDDGRPVSVRDGRDLTVSNVNGSVVREDASTISGVETQQFKKENGNGYRTTPPTTSVSLQRKSLFGNLSPKLDCRTEKVLQNHRRDATWSSLVPYASSSSDDSSSDESDDRLNTVSNGNSNNSSTLKRGAVSALHLSVPRAASSSGWVVDKLNDTPSVNSNSSSSQNSNTGSCNNNTNNNNNNSSSSSVHGTSPGWNVTQETHSPTTTTSTTTGPVTTATTTTITTTTTTIIISQSQTSTTGANGAAIWGLKASFSNSDGGGDESSSNNSNTNGVVSSQNHQQATSPVKQATLTPAINMVGINGNGPSIPTVLYTPRMPPSMQQQNTRISSKPDETYRKAERSSVPAPNSNGMREVVYQNSTDNSPRSYKGQTEKSNTNGSTNGGDTNGQRDGSLFSYWGANLHETKDERELYDEEIDQGRQKKVCSASFIYIKPALSWKNQASRWNNKHRQQNPFQREQDQRLQNGNGIPGVTHNVHFKKQHHRQNHHHFISGNVKQKLCRWHHNGNGVQRHGANGHRGSNEQNGNYLQNQHYSKAQHETSNLNGKWQHQSDRSFR